MKPLSIEVQQLLRFIIEHSKVGQVITYQELDSVLGYDIRRRSRHYLDGMVKAARSNKVFLQCLPRVGFLRLPDSSVPQVCTKTRQSKIIYQTKQWRTDLEQVDISKFNDQELASYDVSVNKLVVQEVINDERMQRQIEAQSIAGKLPSSQQWQKKDVYSMLKELASEGFG